MRQEGAIRGLCELTPFTPATKLCGSTEWVGSWSARMWRGTPDETGVVVALRSASTSQADAMFKSLRARILVILVAVGVCGWYLYQNQVESGSPLKLGLDLQGGMHLVLEIDDPDNTMSADARSDAIDRSEIVIRMRVDELGVSEPLIQKVGQDRLIVELAGITDQDRAKEIIGTTALLEWKLVRPTSDIFPALNRIDRAIVQALGVDSIQALGRAVASAAATPGYPPPAWDRSDRERRKAENRGREGT